MSSNNQFRPQESKLVMIGWDAATWDLLTPWVNAGELPNLAHLIASGSHGAVRSTPLPLSPAAWSSIITGQNPGKHGVFDWFEREPGSYHVDYVHTGRIGAKPLWQYINEGGLSMGVFNLPMIYPAVPLDGFMVAGMAAPGPRASGFTYPKDLLGELEDSLGPYFTAEAEIYKYGREDEYLREMHTWLEYQIAVVHHLIDRHPCDTYLLVFMQSDHIQHKFWRYLDQSFPGYNPSRDSIYQDAILRIYHKMDSFLGELMARFGEQATYVLLSDHGAGPNYGILYINRWLQEEGYLKLKRNPSNWLKLLLAKSELGINAYRLAARLGFGNVAQLVSKPVRNRVVSSFLSFDDIDWSNTKAYSRGAFGQIFINLGGREPQGVVALGEEYERVVAEIIDKLRKLQHPDSGEPLITDLRRREDELDGPYVEQSADILFSIQNYQYQSSVKLGFGSASLLGPSEYEDSGSHRPEGIIVMSGPGIQKGTKIEKASVTDVTPTIMALAGLPIPAGLDGRPLSEAFTLQQRKSLRLIQKNLDDEGDTPVGVSLAPPDLAEDEVAQIEERLRSLGYLG